MRSAPLFFVHSGYVNTNYHYLVPAGYSGNYWSGRAYSSSEANYLSFDSSRVHPSNGYRRYFGLSVRCVAPSA